MTQVPRNLKQGYTTENDSPRGPNEAGFKLKCFSELEMIFTHSQIQLRFERRMITHIYRRREQLEDQSDRGRESQGR